MLLGGGWSDDFGKTADIAVFPFDVVSKLLFVANVYK
jgi:hypothetical protein